MVAPNGARRTKVDHPKLPITVAEIVETARACWDAGAGGLHAHVRGDNGAHILDAGLYRELLAEMAITVPDMLVQITTEAVGMYSPDQQRTLVHDVMPNAVSVSLREMLADGATKATQEFYHWAHASDISVQHILYDEADILLLEQQINAGGIPSEELQAILVLGRYTAGQISDPNDLPVMVRQLTDFATKADWAVCAFGQTETNCLVRAFEMGGKARVGFENNLINNAGDHATDNAARVAEIAAKLSSVDQLRS